MRATIIKEVVAEGGGEVGREEKERARRGMVERDERGEEGGEREARRKDD